MFNTLDDLDVHYLFAPLKPKISKIDNPIIRGFDTETYHGAALLIACSNGQYMVVNDKNRMKIFDFLLKNAGNLNFFYNINYDFDAIIKAMNLPYETMLELHENKEINLGGRQLKIVRGKGFSIQKYPSKKDVVHFFDIASFVGSENTKLNTAAKYWLGKQKEEGIDGEKLSTDFNYWQQNFHKIVSYCIKDCQLTAELGEVMAKHTRDFLGYVPKYWWSKASFAEEIITKDLIQYLRPSNLTKGSLVEFYNFVYKSYHGGMFQSFIKGRCGESLQIDIVSAYPHAMTKLPDVSQLKFFKTDTYSEDAIMGFYKVEAPFNGFMPYKSKSLGCIIYPKTDSPYTNYITRPELEILKKTYKVKILEAWEGFGPCVYSFKPYIEELAAKRIAVKKSNPGLSWVMKIALNSIYGKLVQTNDQEKVGRFFCAPYAAYITALTRIKIYELTRNFTEVFEIATDSIIGKPKNKSDLEKNQQNTLGGYEIKEEYEDLVLLQCGVRYNPIEDRWMRSRGFNPYAICPTCKGKNPCCSNCGGEGIVPRKDIVLKDGQLEIMHKRVVHMPSALRQKRLQDINMFITVPAKISVSDNKMKWGMPEKVELKDFIENTFYGSPWCETDEEIWCDEIIQIDNEIGL